MPNYRRDYSGLCWFFTVVTHRRRRLFDAAANVAHLRAVVRKVHLRYPFEIDGWVVLPDHLHAIWTLPEADRDYSRRWSLIKRRFTQVSGLPRPVWQKRFWAHRIDDEADFSAHMHYLHFNPVKHGYVARVADWPHSTFHRQVRMGVYAADWGLGEPLDERIGRE